MKKWWIIDDRLTSRGQIFETMTNCATLEDVLCLARNEWKALSSYDRKSCDDFFVCIADVGEDGCIDYPSITETHPVTTKHHD